MTSLPASRADLFSDVPPLGFGCCPMGGHGWGVVDTAQLIQAVHTALDLGIRLFDTADVYGLGTSESLLGQALGDRRREAVIATKFGVRVDQGRTFHDTSVAWINTAADASLRRLGVECIDLYQMHYWDTITPMDDIVEALERLIAAGKIQSYGVTNHDPSDPALGGHAAMGAYSFHYSLVHRHREQEIMSVQGREGPTFLSWGSLGQGILSGKYRSPAELEPGDRRRRELYDNFHGVQLAAVHRLLDHMRVIATENDIPNLTQLALRWIIDHVPRSIPLVGIKRPDQIADAAGALRFTLSAETCDRLNRLTEHFGDVPVLR